MPDSTILLNFLRTCFKVSVGPCLTRVRLHSLVGPCLAHAWASSGYAWLNTSGSAWLVFFIEHLSGCLTIAHFGSSVRTHLANFAGQLEDHGVPRSWLASMRAVPLLGDARWSHPWGRCTFVGCWWPWIAVWSLPSQGWAAPLWLLAKAPKGKICPRRRRICSAYHCNVRIPSVRRRSQRKEEEDPPIRRRSQRCLSVAVMLGGSSCTILQYRLKLLACMFAMPDSVRLLEPSQAMPDSVRRAMPDSCKSLPPICLVTNLLVPDLTLWYCIFTCSWLNLVILCMLHCTWHCVYGLAMPDSS